MQLAVLLKFQVATKVLRPLIPFVKLGYQAKYKRNSAIRPYNHAMAQVIKQAIIGEYPDLTVDYAKVLLSDGNYGRLPDVTLSRSGPNLELQYGGVQHLYSQKPDDLIIWVVLCPTLEEAISVEGTRNLGKLEVMVPQHFEGHVCHHYVIACDRDHRRFSKSVYLGQL